MSRRDREARTAELLRQVHQQRLDLNAGRKDWLEATDRFDRGWVSLLSAKRFLAIGSGALAIWSVRHPHFLTRWARRGLGAWSTWRMVRNALPRR